MLVALTVGVAAGTLFVKYKLFEVREMVEARLEERLGGQLQVGSIQVNGLRGLHIQQLDATFTANHGPTLSISLPESYVYINFIDLLYGAFTIDLIQINEAAIVLQRPEDAHWMPEQEEEGGDIADALWEYPFRLTGENCRLEIQNVVGDTALVLESVQFDVNHLSGTEELFAKISGNLDGDPNKPVVIDHFLFHSLEDFDLRTHAETLSATDLNVFLPAERQFIETGVLSPRLRATGHLNQTVTLSLEMNFDGLQVREQPEFIPRTKGRLTGSAYYDAAEQQLSLTNAKLETENALDGDVQGTISFSENLPRFDLFLQVNQLPLDDILIPILEERVQELGQLELTLPESYEIGIRLQGTTEAPQVNARAHVGQGSQVAFTPVNPQLPVATFALSQVQLDWDMEQNAPKGSLTVSDGTIDYAPWGLNAVKTSGVITFAEDAITLSPFNSFVTGQAMLGEATYMLDEQRLNFSLQGGLNALEKTILHTAIRKTELSGALDFTSSGSITKEETNATISINATRTGIEYDWWFFKPIGIGAHVAEATLRYKPKRSLNAKATVDIATTKGTVNLNSHYKKGAWRLQAAEALATEGDLVALGPCLRIPYTPSNGATDEGYFSIKIAEDAAGTKTITYGTFFQDVATLPKGSTAPLTGKGIRVDCSLDNNDPAHLQGQMTVKAEEAQLLQFGSGWVLPLRPEGDPLNEKYPSLPRSWIYTLNADRLILPPWDGTDFSGEAFNTPTDSGFTHFSAQVDAGQIEGRYTHRKLDNLDTFNFTWDAIPAVYLMRHLKFPELLTGTMTGGIDYSIDRDDPNTLQGEGTFEIENGHFSADYLYERFQESFAGEMGALPPSLQFSKLKTNVILQGDKVTTPSFTLESPGITLSGEGFYIIDGDMDYKMNVIISPDTAQHMPILKKYLNVEGHRLTQNDIVLAFHVSGPTFNPNSRVTGTPSAVVTLVSGAGEMANEAIKIIDAPRQILIDMFKIIGGIGGAGK